MFTIRSCGLVSKPFLVFIESQLKFTTSLPYLNNKNALKRKPIRVLNSYNPEKPASKLVPIPHNSKLVVSKKAESALSQSERITFLPIPRYEKLKENDERFTKILTLIKCENTRGKCGKLLLEGVRLINDAIDSGAKLETLFFSQESSLSDIKLKHPNEATLYKLIYKKMKVWSPLETCPGVMGIFQKPKANDLMMLFDETISVTVLGHNIQDPKLIGSIIRNSAAAGCKSILFTKDCTDIWTQRILRAGCGAHFRIPIVDKIEWTHVTNYIPNDSMVYLIDAYNDEYNNEELEDTENEEFQKENFIIKSEEGENPMKVDESFEDEEHLMKFENDMIMDMCYTDIHYPKSNIILCVTEKNTINNSKAIKLACEFGGSKLKIPQENGMNINMAVVFPIILYEIKRQQVEEYVA